jgi:glyceraldehyde 3-phosphate dehydrogenase
VVDLASTRRTPDGAVKVLAWYDNEAGYAARVVELVNLVGATVKAPRPATDAGPAEITPPRPTAEVPVG